MIDGIGKITLYVNDQKEARQFWTEKVGFAVRVEQQAGADMTWLEVGPENGQGPSFVLYEKKLMEMQNPGVFTGHPSLILHTSDIRRAHEDMAARGVKVSELMHMPYGSMFHFFDQDGQMYLLREE